MAYRFASPPVTSHKGFFTEEETSQITRNFESVEFERSAFRRYDKAGDFDSYSKIEYAWFNDEGHTYVFSENHINGIRAQTFPDWLIEIKEKVEKETGKQFNSALINYYSDGFTNLGFHKDDDPWLGKRFIVASLSFGATRQIVFADMNDRTNRHYYDMDDGELLIMGKGCQDAWLHSVPKQSEVREPRYNITFRNVKPDLVDQMPNPIIRRDHRRVATSRGQTGIPGISYNITRRGKLRTRRVGGKKMRQVIRTA
jgi:alkylated DNA repair dioxygenase AlkB